MCTEIIIIAKKYNYNKNIPMMTEKIEDIKSILDFYINAGVDCTCGDNIAALLSANSSPSSVALFASSAINHADNIEIKASTIEELKSVLENFEGCTLKHTATNTVIGDGNPQAKIMFIGEAPGAEEDLTGRAFVGKCGQLLDKMMFAIGLDRSQVYICNILPWRPPGNRNPSDAEIAICLPFLKKQIEIIKPDYILTLGAIAANSLLNTGETMSKLRGKWTEYTTNDGHKIKVLSTYHPSYLLRTPVQKAKSWADFIRFAKCVKQNNQQPA